MLTLYIYWVSTGLLSMLYLFSAFTYVTRSAWVRGVLAELGYPSYLLQFMIVVKILGAAAILSRFNVALSDLAYAGIFYHLILSGIAHLGVKKPQGAVPAAIGMILLVASFATQNTARENPSPYADLASTYSSTNIERL
ncbi:DoxX family protein [Rhizobium leguminosarum bv. viciae]|uniref:DoxX family protein n=1 Tax=Rhizobium leguminosarum TaxID=384 RepID=UPI001039B01C|nr:DoxX family protein [Rhizobium leguminosarum]TCA47826.1 DoxX family protein [Rhizobium leguminosarum bv. viciae]